MTCSYITVSSQNALKLCMRLLVSCCSPQQWREDKGQQTAFMNSPALGSSCGFLVKCYRGVRVTGQTAPFLSSLQSQSPSYDSVALGADSSRPAFTPTPEKCLDSSLNGYFHSPLPTLLTPFSLRNPTMPDLREPSYPITVVANPETRGSDEGLVPLLGWPASPT